MASTTSSTTGGFLSSPRGQKWLYWVSGIVFAAGVIAIITVFATRGSSTPAAVNPPSNPQTIAPPKDVKASSDALQTARKFLETAVVRKNVAASYDLVGPALKTGFTRKQWASGNNTVIPFPAQNAKTTAFVVKYSHPKDLLLQLVLVAKPHALVDKRQLQFNMELNKIRGRWLVNSFTPQYIVPHLPSSGN
jgi:hypothetical protein